MARILERTFGGAWENHDRARPGTRRRDVDRNGFKESGKTGAVHDDALCAQHGRASSCAFLEQFPGAGRKIRPLWARLTNLGPDQASLGNTSSQHRSDLDQYWSTFCPNCPFPRFFPTDRPARVIWRIFVTHFLSTPAVRRGSILFSIVHFSEGRDVRCCRWISATQPTMPRRRKFRWRRRSSCLLSRACGRTVRCTTQAAWAPVPTVRSDMQPRLPMHAQSTSQQHVRRDVRANGGGSTS